ncbi:MAG: helix-turn-helix domain-containing protein [Lachnospiraceae bacterium]|nr:helix-turn-helix domain-containing protein [Ruminococcus sp.]MCM1275815.1 helix-turn-helix domain-containing protein [Lachnospiraceae bacterium]
MEENCVEIFGKRLKELRTERVLSQKQFGDAIGISKSTVGSYECAERTPDIVILARTAKYFDVSLDYLLGNTTARKKENAYACDNLGLSEKSTENIRAITQSGGNANTILERKEFKSIVALLDKIKCITVGRRYYNEKIYPNLENNEFQSNIKLFSSFLYVITQIIERQFNDDTQIDGSVITSWESCDNLYKEKLVLTEYELTEHIFRAIINDIKCDTTKDNETFREFDEQIGLELDYLLMNLQSNLEDAPNRYPSNKLNEKQQEIREDIKALSEFIEFFDEQFRKD